MPKTAQLQEDCDKYYAKALENLAACGYRKVDFDKLSKEDEHFWKKYFQSELFPILSPQIVDSRHPFPFLRNKEIYLGVLLHEKHTSEHTLGIVPISSQMERMHFVRKDNETCFALTEELVLHYAALIFGKENVQEKCLFRVTRNADIDVKEGMMDHDIDYRETGEHFHEQFYEYTYDLDTIRAALEKHGFALESVCDGESFGPLTDESERYFFCAVKQYTQLEEQ